MVLTRAICCYGFGAAPGMRGGLPKVKKLLQAFFHPAKLTDLKPFTCTGPWSRVLMRSSFTVAAEPRQVSNGSGNIA